MQALLNLLNINPVYVFFIFLGYLLLRYYLLSYLFYWVLWIRSPDKYGHLRISQSPVFKNQIKYELLRSLGSLVAMAVFGTLVFHAIVLKGFSALYFNWNDKPLWWIPLSTIIVFAIHDTYFYFTHRLLHLPWFFRNVHAVHHKSKATTPCSSYSFHWIEALTQVLYTLPVLIFIPLHPLVFLAQMAFTHLIVTSGHSGFDVLPKTIWHSKLFSWMTTATHHSHHHLYKNENYGLLTKFWDRNLKTMSQRTDDYYERHSQSNHPFSS